MYIESTVEPKPSTSKQLEPRAQLSQKSEKFSELNEASSETEVTGNTNETEKNDEAENMEKRDTTVVLKKTSKGTSILVDIISIDIIMVLNEEDSIYSPSVIRVRRLLFYL